MDSAKLTKSKAITLYYIAHISLILMIKTTFLQNTQKYQK